MNRKLVIALITWTIIANPSVFAMDGDDEAKISTPISPQKPGKNPWGSDKFLKAVHDAIRAGYDTDPHIDRGNESKLIEEDPA